MKKCPVCKIDKDDSEYYAYTLRKKNQQGYCKFCINERMKKVYANTKDKVIKIKGKSGCTYCGEKDTNILDFHHINPSKDIKVIRVAKITTFKRACEEIKKCEVVCANCHRKLEAGYKLTKLIDMLRAIAKLL